jgi:hypothetical protein
MATTRSQDLVYGLDLDVAIAELKASLGTGVGVPSQTVVEAPPRQLLHLGDSLQRGWTELGWNTSFKTVFGAGNVLDLSESGNTSHEIAARQGGKPAQVTLEGGVLPAGTGSVNVTFDVNPLTNPNANRTSTLGGTLLGVPVIVTQVKVNGVVTSLTLRRVFAGTAVPVRGAVPFVTGYSAQDAIMLFGIGRNNFHIDTPESIADEAQAILDWSNRDWHDHVLYLIPPSTGDSAAQNVKRLAVNAELVRRFGPICFDQGEYLSSTTALAEVGITATAQDTSDITARYIPFSLRRAGDNMHYNVSGYKVLEKATFRLLEARGHVEADSSAIGYKVLPEKTPVSITNIFNSGGGGGNGGGRVLDVKVDFGAVGNGIADDTLAVQRALTAGMALDGPTVHFPPGDYSVTNVGVDYSLGAWAVQPESGAPFGFPGVRITGAGRQKSRIVQRAGATGDVFKVQGKIGTETGPANNNKVTGLEMGSVSIIGTSTGGHGLYLRSLVNNVFHDMKIAYAGKSGIYMARETFTQVDPRDDEYSYSNSWRNVKLTENKDWGLECSGTASIGGTFYDVESIRNGIGGWKVAPTNMTIIGGNAIGNGVGSVDGRGLLSVPNTLTTSVNSALNLIGFRSEGNSTVDGVEVELQSGIGYTIFAPSFYATEGADCLWAGRTEGKTVVSLTITGGFYGISSARPTQKAIRLGAGAINTRIDLGELGQNPANRPENYIVDEGTRTTINTTFNHRNLLNGAFSLARTLASNAVVPPLPGEGQLYLRDTGGGRQGLFFQFESGAPVMLAQEPAQ